MSTKTTFKRISLVAVAALGAGLISVAPANAAALNTTMAVDALVVTDPTASTAVGTAASSTFGVSMATNGDNAVFGAVAVSVTGPTGSAVTVSDQDGAGSVSGTIAKNTGADASVFTGGAAAVTFTDTIAVAGDQIKLLESATAVATSTYIAGTLSLTPDVPGTYVVTLTGRTLASPGVANAVVATFTVHAGYSADTVRPNKAFPFQGAAITSSWTGTAGGQASVRFSSLAASTKYYITTSTGAIVSVTGTDGTRQGTIYNTNGTNLANGVYATTGTPRASDSYDVTVTDLGAASSTVSVKTFDAVTGASTTFAEATVTWGAAPVLSVANSTSIIDTTTSGTTFSAPAADLTVSADGTVATARVATVKVLLKDSALNVIADKVLSAVITGPGLVKGMAGTGTNTFTNETVGARVGTVTTDARGAGYFAVFADGSGGVGTITISQGTTVIATETITFSGIATQLKDNNVDAAGDSLNSVFIPKGRTGTLAVGSYDVAGNKVSATPTGLVVTSDSTTVATVAISGGTGTITVTGVAVGKANITVSVGALATATIKLVIPVEITKTTAKTVTMSFDKATYAPGEKMTLTVKAVDSNGAGVADGARVLFADTATANVALGTLPTGTVTLAGGIKTYTYYAPFAAGDITITAKEGAAVDAVIASTTAAPYTAATITATTTVVNAGVDAATDAASEATDAANAATDAALAAADAADAATAAAEDASAAVAKLAKSVNTKLKALKKQIASLIALVNRLR